MGTCPGEEQLVVAAVEVRGNMMTAACGGRLKRQVRETPLQGHYVDNVLGRAGGLKDLLDPSVGSRPCDRPPPIRHRAGGRARARRLLNYRWP